MPNYGGTRSNEKRGETTYGLPIGAVIAWSATLGSALPAGFILCDGAPYLQTTYPTLYAQIVQTHGNGTKLANGVTASGLVGTAFNVPDYRATSHRGHNGGTTTDFGTRVAQNVGGVASGTGSFEGHSIQGHWHIVYGTIRANRYDTIRPPTYLYSNSAAAPATFYGGQGRTVLTGANGTIRQGKESRGHNSAVLYLIRAS